MGIRKIGEFMNTKGIRLIETGQRGVGKSERGEDRNVGKGKESFQGHE